MLIQLLARPRMYNETLTFKRSIQNGRRDVFKFTLITHIYCLEYTYKSE